jgi:phasin
MNEENAGAGTGAMPLRAAHIDVPEGVKQAAAAGIEQVKERLEKLRTDAGVMTGAVEKSYSMAVKDAADLHARMLEAIRTNLTASFEFATELLAAKSMPEIIEVSTKFARRQFESFTLQTKDFWSYGQKMMSDTAKPVASGFSQGIDRAASS